MAARKPTRSEIIFNVFFWAAMSLSGIGLLIYGAYQLFLKLTGKPFHYFKEPYFFSKMNSKEKKTVTGDATEEEKSEQTTELSVNSSAPSVNDFLDMDIREDVESYRQVLEQDHEEPPVLKIDYTPSLADLMSKTNKKAYESVLAKQRNSIIYHLQNITSGKVDFIMSNDVAATSLLIKNPPQELLDYYAKLPNSPLDARTGGEFCEILIRLAVKKHKEGDKSLMFELDPKELVTHPLYQSVNEFIKQSNDNKFKDKALNQLFQMLQQYIHDNYNAVTLYVLLPNQKGDPVLYGIPSGPQGHYGEDEMVIFLDEYRKKHLTKDISEEAEPVISHSGDPTFSAKGAKKLRASQGEAATVEDKDVDKSEKSLDAEAQSAAP